MVTVIVPNAVVTAVKNVGARANAPPAMAMDFAPNVMEICFLIMTVGKRGIINDAQMGYKLVRGSILQSLT
jgi:hypothetical protein